MHFYCTTVITGGLGAWKGRKTKEEKCEIMQSSFVGNRGKVNGMTTELKINVVGSQNLPPNPNMD